VRRRADRLSSATTALDDTTKARRAAEERLATAEAEVSRVGAELERQHRRRTDLDTELRELLDTPAFQEALGAARRVESLKETLAGLGEQLARARVRTDESRGAFDRATGVHAKARSTVDESTRAVLGSAGAAEAEAGTAGLLASARQHLPNRDVATLRADLDRRETRFARLRSLEREFAEARSEAERAGQLVQQLSAERERAARAEREAATAVELAVDTVRARIRDWAEDAVVAAPAPEQVEDWCDLVAELTAAQDVAEQVSPYAAIRSHVDEVRSRLQQRRADLLRRRDPLDSERRDKRRELEKVSAATESPPPEPLLWRRRTRPEPSAQSGAPFWRCVRPAQGCTLSDEGLARLEAVLAASGLLDAWLTVDGQLTTVDGSEVFLGSSGLALAHDLGAVLEPTPAGGVANDVVSSVLRGVGWRDTRPTDDGDACWLAEDGAWRLGPLTGHAEPAQPASYLGATAREAARQRRIEHLRSRLAELDALIDELDTALAEVDSQLSELDAEARRVPSADSVRAAVAVLTERRERLVAVDGRLDEAREHHLERELARDSAWAGFAEYAGEHAFPTRELDTVASGLARYRDLLRAFESALERLAFREEALRSAEEVLETQRRQLEISEQQQAELENEVRRAEVRLRAAEATMDSDHVAQLQHRDRLDVERVELDERLRLLSEENTTAREDKVRAAGTLDTHEQRRREAEAERESSLAAWWEVVDGGLVLPLELPMPERRVVETALAGARAARKAIPAPTDDQAEDRAWRRCYAQLNSLRDELLPNRDARVDEELDGGTIPRVLILADSTTGWQSPHDASDTLAARVREQEDNYDGEQQRVLTTLLGSTFIEHLKDRLDYTERTFNDINKQLAGHATRHGHVVRLVWEPDPADPDSGAVVAALGHGYQQLGAERQEMVRSFLARKIDTAREEAAADGAVDWKDQLSAALDYRGWLRISLQYRPGTASGWVPFDAARHAAKSGGEKVVLLSQPLFAAAVVAYNAAGEHAPRWVWL
ncbi:MAG: SbcC/MukB-like Walker B domain-containing protein, partial [Sciscionella sp.]